ncbi:MAG: PIN domain-containing protein [Planctomycetaceae bacterium]
MNAIDTNILVYSFDESEPTKRSIARQLIRQRISAKDTVLLWQVAVEFLGCLRRWQAAGRVTADDVVNLFEDVLLSFPLIRPTREILLQSQRLFSRYSLSHWDSLVIAACSDAEVDTLYSEDMQNGQVYDGVRVINPFV